MSGVDEARIADSDDLANLALELLAKRPV